MRISTTELALARERLDALLDGMGLPAYRFEVEPAGDACWRLRVECRAVGGWQRVELEVEKAALTGTDADPEGSSPARERFLVRLHGVLSDCLRVV